MVYSLRITECTGTDLPIEEWRSRSQEPVWGHVETPDITDEGVASTHSVAGRRNQSQELDDDTPSSFEADVDATRESWVQRLHTATRQFIGFLPFRKQGETEEAEPREVSSSKEDIEAGR